MDMTVQKDYGTALKEMKSQMESIKRATARSRSQKRKTKKKKLGYNQREISGQLMLVTRSVGAAQVLVRAKMKVAQLQKCLVSGQYNENEVRAALIHAGKMVKAAKMKLKHLEGEEEVEAEARKRKSPKYNSSTKQQELRLLEQKLKKMRRRNRGKEDREIRNAEMRYMQEKANLARSECQSGQTVQAASSAETVPVVESAPDTTAAADVAAVSVDVCL